MTTHGRPVHGGPDALGVPAHDFSTNGNACGPCPDVQAALRAVDATHYPDPTYTALRGRLAAFHGVAASRIVIAASASEFIFRITAVVAQRGGTAVLPALAYGDYARAALAARMPVRRDGDAPAKGSSLHWCCEPSSPLGHSDPRLHARLDALSPADVFVIDRAYEPLRLGESLAIDAARLDRAWQLWTPNKALGLTGIRGAYAIAPAASQPWVDAMALHAPSWPVGAHGVALLDAWTAPATQQWLAASLHTLRTWKRHQLDLCRHIGWTWLPSDANFFCAAPPVADIAALCAAMREQGVKLRDTASFGLPGHVRMAVLAPGSQAALEDAWRVRGIR